MSGTGQGALFAIADVRSKRPIVNGCKGALCGAVQQNTLGFLKLSTIMDVSQTFARAGNKRYVEALRQNPWVKCKNAVFCTHEASNVCPT